MGKKEALKEISGLISLQEEAIENHPPNLVSAYKETRSAVLAAQCQEWESEVGEVVSLSSGELSMINQYLTCSSFISAWYHLAGIKDQRNKATHSCVQLISMVGPHYEKVFRKYIETERLWRSVIKKYGASPRRSKWKLLLLLSVAGMVCYWLWFK